jgi:hypothetical protein
LSHIKIPDSVNKIAVDVFSCCSKLESIEIPALVTEIGEHTFYKCDNLRVVTILNPSVKINTKAFEECKDVTINVLDTVADFELEGCSYTVKRYSSVEEMKQKCSR